MEKNLRQLAGARRQLFDLKTPIELLNPRRGKEMFDPSPINEVYLISALMGEGESYFSFMEPIKTHEAHVFTRDFTRNILAELDTIADFTGYLRAKESLMRQDKRIILLGGEEELLAFYVLNNRSFARLEGANVGMVDEGSWEHLHEDPRYKAAKSENEISYGWDDIINRANEGFEDYEIIARELARPTRFQRRFLAKSFYDAHVKAHNNSANIFRRVMSFEGVTYCFVFCDEKMLTENREAMLEATCYVARGKHLDNPKVVGIATEKRILPECSYSFCLLELPKWTDQHQVELERIQHETGILVKPTATSVQEREYPG